MAEACAECSCPCLIIDRACMIRYTPFTTTIDPTEMSQSLDMAQEEYVGNILGDCLEELCAELEKESPDEKWVNLQAALTKSLAWYAYYNWIVFYSGVKPTRKGLRKKISEESTPATTEEIDAYALAAQGRADREYQIFKKWWVENVDDYSCAPEDCKLGIESIMDDNDDFLGGGISVV